VSVAAGRAPLAALKSKDASSREEMGVVKSELS